MAVRRGTDDEDEEGVELCWNPKKEEVEDLRRPDLIEGERPGRGRPNEEDDFGRGEVERRRADIRGDLASGAKERHALSERGDV